MPSWLQSPSAFISSHADLFSSSASTVVNLAQSPWASDGVDMIINKGGSKKMPPHSSHPALGHLILLVFEAVLEVVCVSLPGYIVAIQGLFDADAQKLVANLNVWLFTPCLIFTKLASQLTLSKLADLAVIPVIFLTMTTVSYFCSYMVARAFKFKPMATNFVIAMGVFGNSNSLPLSLVTSLSYTLKGLHWDKIPGDNDDNVASRGILYLLIFQQLGQLLRWSWGYHVLLKPASAYAEEGDAESVTGNEVRDEIRAYRRRDESSAIDDSDSTSNPFSSPEDDEETAEYAPLMGDGNKNHHRHPTGSSSKTGAETPITPYDSSLTRSPTEISSISSESSTPVNESAPHLNSHTETNGTYFNPRTRTRSRASTTASQKPADWKPPAPARRITDITSFPSPSPPRPGSPTDEPTFRKTSRHCLRLVLRYIRGFAYSAWAFMNPPLWAMFAAVIVASIPKLQALFFTPGSFLQNSVSRAVAQSGGVAVPLILVVLGANLARTTHPTPSELATEATTREEKREEMKILLASLAARMVLPFVFIAPLLALAAKYVPISILDDPIFVIVCFLLTGAPSALQLAQICQINGVYEGVMARILFWSYVVVILPSTLVLVISGLEVVEWAA